MKLLRFELKKIWRRKKLLIVFLLLTAFVSGMFIRNSYMQAEIKKEALSELEPHIEETNMLVGQYQQGLEQKPDSERLKIGYENAKKMRYAISNWRAAIESEDWAEIPSLEAEFLQAISFHKDLGGFYTTFTEEEFQQSQEKNAILLQHNIQHEPTKYSLAISNFMKEAVVFFLSIFGIIMLIFIFGDQHSEEFENQTNRTLVTQPIKRLHIILSKYASMMISLLLVLLFFLLLCFIIPFLMGGRIGSFSYPHLILIPDGFTFISIGEYLGKYLILFIGTVSFIFSLVLLISSFIKNRYLTYIISLIVIAGGFGITNQGNALQDSVNPFSLFQYKDIIEHSTASAIFGSVCLLFAYSFILLVGSYLIEGKSRINPFEKLYVQPFRKGKPIQSSNGLSAILLFECRKLWRLAYVKQTLFIFLLLFIGGYLYLSYETKQLKQDFVNKYETSIAIEEQKLIPQHEQNIQEQLNILEGLENKQSPLTQEEQFLVEKAKVLISTYEDLISNYQLEIEEKAKLLQAYTEKDWLTFYEYWIKQNRYQKGENIYSIPFNDNRRTERTGLSRFTYESSIVQKELLIERNIEPVLSPEFLYTIYDRFINPIDQLEWMKRNQKVDNTALFYLYTFYDLFLYFLPIVLLLFLFGAGFTSEKGKKRMIHFLKTQPLSKQTLFIGKMAVSVGVALSVAVGTLLLMVILGIVGNRFGDWTYPILYYDAPDVVASPDYTGYSAVEGGFHFINMGGYIVETSLLFLAAILFLITLSILLSTLLNNTISLITSVLIFSFGGYFISTIPAVSAISHLLPFTYLNIGKIANGEIATILTNSSIQTWTGIIVFSISSFILLGVRLIRFRKFIGKSSNQTNISKHKTLS